MRLRHAVAAAVASVLVVPLSTVEAGAATPTRFSRVQYDSPGSDRGSNASLNAEWVRITNHGGKVRNLSGWKVRDQDGHLYRIPRGFKLRPGRSVTIHTGRGRNTSSHLYQRRDWYVWNNDGDRATLRNRAGATIDTCSWDDGPGSKNC